MNTSTQNPVITFAPLDQVETMGISSSQGSLLFDRESGILRSFTHKGTEVDLFTQTRGNQKFLIGGLRIWDDLDKRWWDDFTDLGSVEIVKESADELVFNKGYDGCPFVVQHQLKLRGDGINWNLECSQSEAVNRGLRIVYQLPLVAGWGIFAPCLSGHLDRNKEEGDDVFDGCTMFNYMYHMGPYYNSNEVTVPFFAQFDRSSNTGFALAAPAEANIPSLHYEFTNRKAFAWATQDMGEPNQYTHLDVSYGMIGLHGTESCTVEMELYFGDGCWRPLLGQYVEAHKPMFYPRCDAVWERAGTFKCGGLLHGEDDTVRSNYKALGGKYFEFHGHFPYYGKYFNEGEWEGIGNYERRRGSKVDPNAVDTPDPITQERLKKAIDVLNDDGISVHYYINFVDGDRDYCLVNHPDSTAVGEDGKPYSSGWRYCDTLHPFPGTSGYQSLKDDAINALKTYNIDGFFYDCFRHFDIDFKHSDGVTMLNNKPASTVLFSMANLAQELVDEGYLDGKDTFANKPRTIQSMGYVDGMLLEGDGRGPEMFYNYTTLAKPNFYMWGGGVLDEEEQLKRALVLGAFPNDTVKEDQQAAQELYANYLPLYEYFRRRVFCFEAEPVHLDLGLEGELYTVGDNYVLPISNQNVSVQDEPLKKRKEISITVSKADYVSDVFVHYAGEEQVRKIDVLRDGPKVVVPLPLLRSACVIVFEVDKEKNPNQQQTSANANYFDSCGDPVSAFEMGTGRSE